MQKILNDPELRKSMSKVVIERAKYFEMGVWIRKYTDLIGDLDKD